MDVALASCLELPEPDLDEAPLLAALAAAGLEARSLAWDDPAADFASARLTLLRATWNYPLHPEAFLAWAARTAAVSQLVNPLAAVRWNVHKGYLLDLQGAGVPIVPTVLVRRGSPRRLADVLGERGWHDAVIKPAISAASLHTLRATRENLQEAEQHLAALAGNGDVLIQPYLPGVEGYGERAVMVIDGEVTHAVRKSPRFAGEDECVTAAIPSAAEAALARHAVAATGTPLVYARVDMVPGPAGEPVVMELELIEPSLFFPFQPASAARLANAAARLLARA